MSATEELKHEHRAIERMLVILEAAAARADAGQGLRTKSAVSNFNSSSEL